MESLTSASVYASIYFVLFTSVLLLLLYKFRFSRKVRLINKIPGPYSMPIFGNVIDISCGGREFFARLDGGVKLLACHFSVMKSWLFDRPFLLISTPSNAEAILGNHKHLKKSNDYRFLHPWLGTGLLTAEGTKWHQRRKMLTPTFHFKILDDFVEVFNQQSLKLVSLLKKKANGESFDIFPFIALCTLDIILETAMGRRINAQDNSESEYVKSVYKIGSLVQLRQTHPWLQIEFLFNVLGYAKEQEDCLRVLHGFSYQTIRERKKEHMENQNLKSDSDEEKEYFGAKRKRLAFLDLLLENSSENDLCEEDIREEVDTFMFEGHDTTAAAINWTIYLLGCYPDIQKTVHEELDSVLGEGGRAVTAYDLKNMKFLDCCIKEALRLFPSVPIIARELQEEDFIGGYTVPAGTTALILTYRMHRDSSHFPDPEVFNPQRFLPENLHGRHPYAYVPFSAGPRNCIGQRFAQMEEKLVVANIFRNFRVESTVRREDLKILGELILRPEEGNVVRLFPRTYDNWL